jgi:hypothetical protein
MLLRENIGLKRFVSTFLEQNKVIFNEFYQVINGDYY